MPGWRRSGRSFSPPNGVREASAVLQARSSGVSIAVLQRSHHKAPSMRSDEDQDQSGVWNAPGSGGDLDVGALFVDEDAPKGVESVAHIEAA